MLLNLIVKKDLDYFYYFALYCDYTDLHKTNSIYAW